jgi:hypothetical protein
VTRLNIMKKERPKLASLSVSTWDPGILFIYYPP